MIAGVQIIGIVFALVMIYLTFVYYKRKNYDAKSMVLWMIIWIGILLIIGRPETVYGIMQALEIERTADFIVMAGFTVFSVILFYLYVLTKRTNNKVEELVRRVAFGKVKKKKK